MALDSLVDEGREGGGGLSGSSAKHNHQFELTSSGALQVW